MEPRHTYHRTSIFRDFHNEYDKNLIGFMFIRFCLIFLFFFFAFFILKGKYYKITLSRRKHVKCTDSYDVIYLSTCYIQLLFRVHYSMGSLIEYQDSVLFWGFTFNTVFWGPWLPRRIDEISLAYYSRCYMSWTKVAI